MTNLTERQSAILAAVEQCALTPLAALAKNLGYQEHAVGYAIRHLKQRGIILDKVPLIDFYRLGYIDCTIALTLFPQKREKQDAFVKYVRGMEGLLWFAELSGEYQYWISLCIRHPFEAYDFLGLIGEKFGNIVLEKEVSLRVSFVSFGRKYLLKQPSPSPLPTLSFGGRSQDEVEIDGMDERILDRMCNERFDSKRAVARSLELPVTTVERRMALLEDKGVIKGYFYRFDSRALGVESVKLLLYTGGITKSVAKAIYAFSSRHERIRSFSECSGAWDYELNVEAAHLGDIAAVIQDLREQFGSHILRVRQLPVVTSIKFSGYPFRNTIQRRSGRRS